MTYGRKTGGKDIKKGQVLNPKGRPPVPEHVRTARKLTQARFAEILYKYINSNIPDLSAIANKKDTPAIDLVVIKILTEAIKHGDEKRLNFLLERMIGKVKEVKDFNHKGLSQAFNLKNLSVEELTQLSEMVSKCELTE